MARSFLKSSLENATFNIVFQILFRCITFVLNAFVLRYVSQAVVGVMNVRLLLLESTILYLSREAFRRACLSKTTEHNWAQVVNLLWLTVPLCQLCCLVFGYVWLHVLEPPSEDITQHYALGVWSICVSCVVEMCCEPVYLVSQAFLFVRLKVVLDTALVLVRTAIFVPLIVHSPNRAVVAFSVAQLASATVYSLGFYAYFYAYIRDRNRRAALRKKDGPAPADDPDDDFPFRSLYDFLPAKVDGLPPIDRRLAALTWSFFKQGVLKQVLTEGERYVMTVSSVLSFREQGMYDVVNNLGSLAARFLFRPVEDAAYFYFSQMVHRDASIQEQNQKHMAESSGVLRRLLRCIASLGLVILVFGQSYATLLLALYGGARLARGPGPVLMRFHCLSVLLLAVNGITECYAFATMSTGQLDRYNLLMAVLSVSFLFVSWALTTLLGGVGFILANCCNMAARIAHSVIFIRDKYSSTAYNPLSGLVPGRLFLLALFAAGVVTKISEEYLFEDHKLLHLCIGAASFAVVLLSWAYEERELVALGVGKWRQRRASLKQD
ncbi:protein RFT1 homolog [Bacillus rossius redtenbacheri]|uniref:protein RFT1 homolog n=1 Tax=Bacillus rossius redtenbacheri TaxID=93214 RepID=UPI002FDE72AC